MNYTNRNFGEGDIMSRTHEQFVNELKLMNPSVKVLGTYTKANEPVEVECLKCYRIWNPRAYSLLQGKGCAHCSALRGARNNTGKTKRKTQIEFIQEVQNVNPDIIVQGPYESNKSLIRFKCKRCGNTWDAKAYSVLQGHGCPRCAKSGTSFMEQYIYYSFLKSLGDGSVLSRDRNIIGMELDIVIPEYKIAIEPGNWGLHKKNIKRDAEKRKRCQDKGIRLITIYDKFDGEEVPFSNDCYIFQDDLNKAGHDIILNLVYSLFELLNIQKRFTSTEVQEIEDWSYKHAKSMLHEDFVERMKTIHPDIKVLGEYVNSSKKIQVRCMKCDYVWDGVPANMLSGDGCRKCGTIKAHESFVRNRDDFIKELFEKNPDVEVIGNYVGRHKPIRARCKICGLEWNPIAGSLLRGSSHKGSKGIHKNMK